MIVPIPTHNDAKIFLQDWGINPGADGITGYVYCQMLKDAITRYGNTFANLITGIVDSTTGKYRLTLSWEEVGEKLNKRYRR